MKKFVIFLLLVSCGVPTTEHNALLLEHKELKAELEECKFGAEKLLSQATNYFDNKEYDKSKIEVTSLLERHLSSPEAVQAKEILKNVNIELDKIAKAEAKPEGEKIRKEKQRLTNATSKMRKKVDDMRGTITYEDKTSPRYVNSQTNFYVYMIQRKNSLPSLRLIIQYVADDWLFIDKYIIKVDDKTYEITENSYGEIKTDSGGGIWEWFDRSVGRKELQIIKAVANGKNVKIRFSGSQYYKDRTISSKEKLALRNVLDAYEALGGTI